MDLINDWELWFDDDSSKSNVAELFGLDYGSSAWSQLFNVWSRASATNPSHTSMGSPQKSSDGPASKSSPPPSQALTSPTASFQLFQDSTEDAWDVGDDEFFLVSDVKISKSVVQSSARSVLEKHQTSQQQQQQEERNNYPHGLTGRSSQGLQRLGAQFGDLQESQNQANKPSGSEKPLPHPKLYPGRPQLLSDTTLSAAARKAFEERQIGRVDKFVTHLSGPHTSLEELRSLSWSGIPAAVRPDTWRLLCGYLPANIERRQATLERKREEYWGFVRQYYETRHDDIHQDTFRQIHIDIPRMSPLVPLLQQPLVQQIFERLLFIWAIRHPASGYVQGINDLVTPFFLVFLQEKLPEGSSAETFPVSQIDELSLKHMEADAFWCLSKLLDGIQDQYTFAQPGIQTKVKQLEELIGRVDSELHRHLISHEVDYLQFSFRWMNNLLMRELPLPCTIRLWDTCLSEPHGFAKFHLYVCAAFLLRWRTEILRQYDFQSLMLLLQNLPTHNWSEAEISLLLAEAFKLKYMFEDAPNHLATQSKGRRASNQ